MLSECPSRVVKLRVESIGVKAMPATDIESIFPDRVTVVCENQEMSHGYISCSSALRFHLDPVGIRHWIVPLALT